jgi:hypothetical protein
MTQKVLKWLWIVDNFFGDFIVRIHLREKINICEKKCKSRA